MKKIVFFLFFISLYNCQPKIEKIRYETSMGIPVEKSIAKNYLDVYKKVFLLDNETPLRKVPRCAKSPDFEQQ